MTHCNLKVNMVKTEYLVFPPTPLPLCRLIRSVEDICLHPVKACHTLGFIFFILHIQPINKSFLFFLYSIAKTRPFLSITSAKSLVHAVLVSCLQLLQSSLSWSSVITLRPLHLYSELGCPNHLPLLALRLHDASL